MYIDTCNYIWFAAGQHNVVAADCFSMFVFRLHKHRSDCPVTVSDWMHSVLSHPVTSSQISDCTVLRKHPHRPQAPLECVSQGAST